jgi:hypothetical protein
MPRFALAPRFMIVAVGSCAFLCALIFCRISFAGFNAQTPDAAARQVKTKDGDPSGRAIIAPFRLLKKIFRGSERKKDSHPIAVRNSAPAPIANKNSSLRTQNLSSAPALPNVARNSSAQSGGDSPTNISPMVNSNGARDSAPKWQPYEAFKTFERAEGTFAAHIRLADLFASANRDADALAHYEAARLLQPDR